MIQEIYQHDVRNMSALWMHKRIITRRKKNLQHVFRQLFRRCHHPRNASRGSKATVLSSPQKAASQCRPIEQSQDTFVRLISTRVHSFGVKFRA